MEVQTVAQLEPGQLTLVGVRELEKRMGMTRRVFYELEEQGEFPKRIRISHKHVAYYREEVQQYLAVVQAGGKWSEFVAAKAIERKLGAGWNEGAIAAE